MRNTPKETYDHKYERYSKQMNGGALTNKQLKRLGGSTGRSLSLAEPITLVAPVQPAEAPTAPSTVEVEHLLHRIKSLPDGHYHLDLTDTTVERVRSRVRTAAKRANRVYKTATAGNLLRVTLG